MSDVRRSLCWVLAVVLFTTIAVMVSGEPDGELDTTPSTWHSGPGDLTEVHP